MTVPQQEIVSTHVANGVTTVFGYGFYCIEARDLIVSLNGVDIDVSQYTVSGLKQLQGGEIIFFGPPLAGSLIAIRLQVAPSRETNYKTNGDLFAKVVNLDFDRLWLGLQSAFWSIGRALRLGTFDIDGAGAYRARQNRIQDLRDPIFGQDAANRQWVQAQIAKLATDGSGQVVIDMLADGSSDALGDALVAVRQPYGGAIAISQHEQNSYFVTPKQFGAVGNDVNEDLAAIQRCWDAAAAARVAVRMTKGLYRINGQLNVRNGLHVIWDNDAWLRPTLWAASGAYITNVDPVNLLESEVENVLLENVRIDGSNIALATPGNSNGAAFARGAKNIRIRGAHVKNLPYSFNLAGGFGGKAIAVEKGVVGFTATDIYAENCGVAIFAQGVNEFYADGVKQNAVNIIFDNVHAENCNAAAVFAGITTDGQNPNGDPSTQLVLVGKITYHNCGHAPWRPVASDHKKSGVIVFGEAQNVRIESVQGYNDAAYPQTSPGYPTDPNMIGQGLTGPIGAIVWGWGRNISIGHVEHHGDVDSLVHIERARAHGDDASPTGTPQNVFRFDVDCVRHFGTASYALTQGVGARGPDETMTGRIALVTDVLTVGFVGSDFGNTFGVSVEVRDSSTGAIVEGSAPDLVAYKNTFAGATRERWTVSSGARISHAERFVGKSYTIADDSVLVLAPDHRSGTVLVVSETSALRAHFSYRCSATGAQSALMTPAISNVAVALGALTGVTGTDGAFTFSADNAGNLYLENRRGASISVAVTFVG